MKKFIGIILVLAMILTMASCGNKTGSSKVSSTVGSSTAIKEKTKIAVIVPQKRGDLGFTDSIYRGVEKIQADFGDVVEITFNECAGDSSKFESTIYDTCDQKPDLIITPAGSGFADLIATKAAQEYKDIDFYIVDINAAYKGITSDNVTALSYKQNEATFLTGALAAMLSQSNTIGYVAGISNAVINDFTVGYIQGGQYVNPDIKILISYIGDFQDSAKAKELAASQIGLGADVVSQVAGTAGLGVLDAAKENKVWGIGVDSDQALAYATSNPELSKRIATSAIKNGDLVIYNFAKEYLENKDAIKWGQIVSQGLSDGVVAIAPLAEAVPSDVCEKIAELEAKVTKGEISVVSAFDISDEEFQNYVKSCEK